MGREKLLIIGAAGRDFHNFNVLFRDNDDVEVVAFTAAQIPDIADRRYPIELAGELYPEGIPIFPEDELEGLIADHGVDTCIFSYSDVDHQHVGEIMERVNAAGANFATMAAEQTMIESEKPVVAVCAVRTGCGKSQLSRFVCQGLSELGQTVVPIRHPMPYGDLAKQAVQRFATLDDLKAHDCTIEEMEEYEPHIAEGRVIYAGVDFYDILEAAEEEADIILWDGGNNDTSFYTPDVLITIVDPLRPGHELMYYPGPQNLLMADIVVINKVNTADATDVANLKATVVSLNPEALIIEMNSPVKADLPEFIKDQSVLVIEDGPTTTHGGMQTGAATVAAHQYDADEIVDPRPYLQGKLAETFEIYPGIGSLLPAMGYGDQQIADLQATIEAMAAAKVIDTVIIGTPIDLGRVIKLPDNVAVVRATYSSEEIEGEPSLRQAIADRLSVPVS